VRADSISRAVFARARTSRQAFRSAYATATLAMLHGRWQEGLHWLTLRSEASVRAVPSVANRLSFTLDTASLAAFRGDYPGSRTIIRVGLARYPTDSMPPSERPWDELVELGAAIGDSALCRRALAGYDRDLASSARDPEGRRAYFQAHVAVAERRWTDAADLFREADRRRAIERRYAQVQMGKAYDRAGLPDSAVAYYESFLKTPDPQPLEDARWRAQTHRRLGELYEARGAAPKAIEQYNRFVELWAEADPDLQPQVAEVRKRLERLRAAVG
jgi:tetratricopeptide (TPR) repeat protein